MKRFNAKIIAVRPSRNGGLPFAICQLIGTTAEVAEFKAVRDAAKPQPQRYQIAEDGTLTFTVGVRGLMSNGIKARQGSTFQLGTTENGTYVDTNTDNLMASLEAANQEVLVRQLGGQASTAPAPAAAASEEETAEAQPAEAEEPKPEIGE